MGSAEGAIREGMAEMGDDALDALERDIGSWARDFEEEGDLDGVIIKTGTKICRYCGKTKLRWQKLDGRWCLFENNEAHSCKALARRPK